jgi:hypothetical protein
MTMPSDMTVTNRSGEANVLPTECPWCLAVAAVALTAAMLLFFFW